MKVIIVTLLCVSSLWASPLKPTAQISTKKLGGRIIGGEAARGDQFPFAAAVRHSTSDGTYFCVGTLISVQYVLTSGFCVDAGVLFQIRLGSIYATQADNNALLLSTAEFYLNTNYDQFTKEGDAGLIRFRQPVTLTDFIQPITALNDVDFPGQWDVIAIGWGATSDAAVQLSEELQYVYVSSVTSLECSTTYGAQILDSMICVEGQFNQGTCAGDFGGPLVWYQSATRAVHVGISSFISSNGCESTDPSGYIKTSSVVGWITETTEG